MFFRWHYPIWSGRFDGFPTPLFRIDEHLSGQYPAVTDFFALLSFAKVCAGQPIAIQDIERAEQFIRATLLHDGLVVLVPEIVVLSKMDVPSLLVLGAGWYPHPLVERYHFALPSGLACAVRCVTSSLPMHLSYITWDELYQVKPDKVRAFFKGHSEARKKLKAYRDAHVCGLGGGYFKLVGNNLNEYVGRQRYYDRYIGERMLLSLYKSPVTAYLSEQTWSQIDFMRYVTSPVEVYFKDNRHVGYLNEIEKLYDQAVSAESRRPPIRLPLLLSCVLSYAENRESVLDVVVQLRHRLPVAMKDVWHNVFDMDRMDLVRDCVRLENFIRESIQKELGVALGTAGSLNSAAVISAAAVIVHSQDFSKMQDTIVGKVVGALRRPSFRGIIEIAEVARGVQRAEVLYDKLGITLIGNMAPRSFDGFLIHVM